MIISHKYQFIFIKTVKTAGTSIEVFLSQHCGKDDVVTPISPQVEPHRARNYTGWWDPFPEIIEYKGHGAKRCLRDLIRRNRFYNHLPARKIKARISKNIWNTYFKFCVERNPWDKTLSHYAMINDRLGGDLTLDEYLNRNSFCINFHRYTDSYSRLMVDTVIRYESLREELGDIFAKLGIPFDGDLGVWAKAGYRHDKRPYRDVYTAEQANIIESVFAREIAMFGYQF